MFAFHAPFCRSYQLLVLHSLFLEFALRHVCSIYVCMYVCMYGHHIYSRVWINRVRLPILLVVS